MKEERYFYVPDASHQNELPKEEAQHALRVLRMQAGDEMFLMDVSGKLCLRKRRGTAISISPSRRQR